MSFKQEFEKRAFVGAVAGVARGLLTGGARAAMGTARALPKVPGATFRGVKAVGKESAGFVSGPLGAGLTLMDVNDKRKAINAAASRPLGT